MISTELQKTETVANIFRNMSLGVEAVNIDLAKNWLNEYMPKGNITDKLLPHVSSKKSVIFSKKDDHCDLTPIGDVLNLLEERRSVLISMLVYLKYTWNNANLIIDTFINSIKAYQVEFQINPCSFIDSKYCEILASDLLMNVRFIARSFFKGTFIFIRCLSSDDLLPFYFLLAQLSKQISLHISELKEDNVKSEDLGFDIIKNREANLSRYRNSDCPMIITEDADIDAAVDSFCKSICQSQAQVTSSVSHILIDESVYERTVMALENSLKRIRHGSRFDKLTELELIDNVSNVDMPSHLNLKIFSPCNKSPIKLCIGWNPKDINDAKSFPKSSGFIPVIPYRNLSELNTLVKDNFTEISPASLWCENIAVTKLDSEFQFSPLWINCHGPIHPLFPHYSPYILSTEESKPSSGVDGSCYSNSLSLVLECAKKGYYDWQKCQLNKLQSLMDFLNSSDSKTEHLFKGCRKCGILNQGIKSRVKSFVDSEIKSSVSKAQITCSSKPVGIVIIFCGTANSPCFTECLQRLVAASLINGNSVIVIAEDDLTMASCKKIEASQVFKSLPKGILSFLLESNFYHELLIGKINLNYKPSLRLICLDKDFLLYVTNVYDFSWIDLNTCFCDEALFNLTSVFRSVWIA